MIAMVGGEPTLIFGRIEDLPEALRVADEMGLPLTNPSDVDDDILALIRRAFAGSRPLRTRVSGALHQPRFPPSGFLRFALSRMGPAGTRQAAPNGD